MAATVESREMEPASLQVEEKTPNRAKSAPTKKKTPGGTVPKPFNLGLDKRIAERKSYQEGLQKRQKEAEEREKIAQEEREEEDKKELKVFRKSLTFKRLDKLSEEWKRNGSVKLRKIVCTVRCLHNEGMKVELEHYANPIRKYREVEIAPSNKDLTCPMAPTFATDARLHLRMSDGASSNGGSISPSHSSNSQPSNSSPM